MMAGAPFRGISTDAVRGQPIASSLIVRLPPGADPTPRPPTEGGGGVGDRRRQSARMRAEPSRRGRSRR